MSAYVGLATLLFTPSPRARPRTKHVLPAPRSPSSATTVPGATRAPSSWARRSVASGERETKRRSTTVLPASHRRLPVDRAVGKHERDAQAAHDAADRGEARVADLAPRFALHARHRG